MAEITWTEPALEDVRAIVAFVGRDSPGYAQRLADRIMQAPESLAAFPRLGGMVPEFEQDDIREVIVRPYRVIYQLREDKVFVVAVIHGSRDLPAVFKPG
jgi:toxin ParE1/3/4